MGPVRSLRSLLKRELVGLSRAEVRAADLANLRGSPLRSRRTDAALRVLAASYAALWLLFLILAFSAVDRLLWQIPLAVLFGALCPDLGFLESYSKYKRDWDEANPTGALGSQ